MAWSERQVDVAGQMMDALVSDLLFAQTSLLLHGLGIVKPEFRGFLVGVVHGCFCFEKRLKVVCLVGVLVGDESLFEEMLIGEGRRGCLSDFVRMGVYFLLAFVLPDLEQLTHR